MEQRSLRLGDIVDDYCPRERRVTNHAIVALVGESIRQTRCATCDAEHEYKEGRVPRKKTLKDGAGDLAGGVLVTPKAAGNGQAPAEETALAAAETAPLPNGKPVDPASESGEEADGNRDDAPLPDGWLAHRPLIRASLPRTDADPPPPRPIPEFTMHQRQGRGFSRGFRHGYGGGGGGGYGGPSGPGGNGNGNAPPREGNGNTPDGNRAPRPGGGGGKSRHRRRHRRPR